MSEPPSLFKHIFILRSVFPVAFPVWRCMDGNFTIMVLEYQVRRKHRGGLSSHPERTGKRRAPKSGLALKWDTVLSQPWRQLSAKQTGNSSMLEMSWWILADWGNSQIQNSSFMESLALGNMLFTKIYLEGTNSELWFVNWLQKIIPVRAESLYVQQLWGVLKVGIEQKRHKTATEL